MQPEISTRCSLCGAAVRAPAMFCPECGKPMAPASRPVELPAAAEIPVPALTPANQAEPVAEQAQSTPEIVGLSGPAADGATTANKTDKPAEPAPPHGARERTRERLQRASIFARGALQ